MSARRTLGYGLAASLVGLAALMLSGLTSALDRRVYDLLLGAAGGGLPSGRVAIVVVDDRSLSVHGSWPWPHAGMANLIDRLDAAGAAVVALDAIVEAQARESWSPGPADGTDALVAALHASQVVVGHAITFGPASEKRVPCVVLPLEGASGRPPASRDLGAGLFQAVDVECTAPEIAGAASSSGYLNLGTDDDEVLRRLPLVMSYRNGTVPSLAVAAAGLARGGAIALARARGRPLALDLAGGGLVPLDDRGTIALRFRSGEHAFPHVSAADVLDGRVDAAVLRNRVVFVGTAAADQVAVPGGRRLSRLVVHATAADNLLRGDFIINAPYARPIVVAATLVLGPLAAWLVLVSGVRRGAIAAGGLAAGLWIVAAVLVQTSGLFLSPALPTLAVLGTIGAALASRLGRERLGSADEQRRRQQAQALLVQSLMTMVELRDPSTGRHARRTQAYCRLLAQRLAHVPGYREYLTAERIEYISWLAPLHDIGKVGVRDAVLGKPSALSEDEITEMRRHPIVGFEAISRAQRYVGMDSAHDDALLQIAKDIVYTHHERWDGGGYPRGLRGREIPVAGRIVAVVDVYDALVEARPYRRRIPHQEAVDAITCGRGTQFDPEVVDAFMTVSNDFLELGTRLREEPVQAW
jgi:adenylate cyclase